MLDHGRRDEEDGGEGRGSAAVDGGNNDGDGKRAATCAEDEDINWDDAAEGIGEGIEGPEGFRDSDDDDEGRGGETEGRHAGGAKSRTARAERATAEHEGATETLPGAPEPTREVSPRVWGRFAKNRAKSAPPQRVALIALAHRHLRTAVRERDAAHMPLPASAK